VTDGVWIPGKQKGKMQPGPCARFSHFGRFGNIRKYKVVKSAGPDDLVFQSVKDGRPMTDQNILKRHIPPAAGKLGLPFVNWQCRRTSHATWMILAGADPKSVRGKCGIACVDHNGDICSDRSSRTSDVRCSKFLS
jgi:hypothetical protein